MFFGKNIRKYVLWTLCMAVLGMSGRALVTNQTLSVYASEINENTDDPSNPQENQPEKPEDKPSDSGQTTPETTTPEKTMPVISGLASYEIQYPKQKNFALNLTTTGDSALSYISTDPTVAMVNESGIVTVYKAGTCRIFVVSQETEKYHSASFTITISAWKRPEYLGYAASYKNSKYYRRLKNLKLTGDVREDMLAVAKSQVGYYESSSSKSLSGYAKGSGNYTEFGRFYRMNGVPWCAIFVNWVARENGISLNTIPKECAVRLYYSYFRKKGKAYSWSVVRKQKRLPQKGDIIFYSYSRGATTHHIGYVENCTFKGSKIILEVVEGNHKNAVRATTMVLKTSNKSGAIRGMYITGFASPY